MFISLLFSNNRLFGIVNAFVEKLSYNILFIQIESLVETSGAIIENVPPRMDDEEALLAVAKGIIGSVKVNLIQPPKDGSSGP